MRRGPSVELPTGVFRTPHGFRAFVRVNGVLHSERFPPDTPIRAMTNWREERRIRIHAGLPTAETPGPGFRTDAAAYLEAVRSMATFRWRKDDIALWVVVFGDRPRSSIQAHEIRAQLARWRAGYAANTCNHRRTALLHLWSILDGKSAPNPVRDVPRYRDDSTDSPPRTLSDAALDLLFAAMRPSPTRARLRLFRYTGWPQAQIKRIDPKTDIRWDDAVWVRPRRKGKTAAGAWLPLLPAAWDALREMRQQGAWGTFRTDSLRNGMLRAARKARRTLATAYARRTRDRGEARRLRMELLRVTPYQLRHGFLTLVADESRDDRAVMTLGQHADIRTSHRYTQRTADPRAAAAIATVTRNVTDRAAKVTTTPEQAEE